VNSMYGTFDCKIKNRHMAQFLIYKTLNVNDCDNVIFCLRNPLRVYLSRQAYKADREEWGFLSTMREIGHLIVEYKNCSKRNMLVLHERLCRNFSGETKRMYDFVSMAIDPICDPLKLRLFWTKTKCGVRPIEKDGWFVCPKCKSQVKGYGNFNPYTVPSLSRAIDKDLDGKFNEGQLKTFRDVVGDELAEYWLNDSEHQYKITART